MAEVFGTLSVAVFITRTRRRRHAQLVRADGEHLRVQALAHLGAAVVQLHGAVRVDEHQRAGLVEEAWW